MLSLDTPIADTGLIRIDKKSSSALDKLKLTTVGDVLSHFPRRYEDRTQFDIFPEGPMETPVCLHVVVTDAQNRFGRGKFRRYFEATTEPVGGSILGNKLTLRWFNLSYIQKIIAVGQELVVYGQTKTSGRKLVMDHPDFEIVEGDPGTPSAHMGRIIPIYPLASGIGQKQLRSLQYEVLQRVPDSEIPDWLPPGSEDSGLSRAAAIKTVHYPSSSDSLEPARRYLALEEFAKLQLELMQRKAEQRDRGGRQHCGKGELFASLIDGLPFPLTGAQERTISEIREDLASSHPMVRLLQGDVGAGKTLVAAAAISLVIEAGFDAALMAPTQILAEQHFSTLQSLFEPLGVEVRLKTGAKQAGGELPLFQSIESRRYGSVVVGTHALIHGDDDFPNGLGLAVIDEQHKFGVAQRQALISKGDAPDVLVMTATPIPRTLALAFYSDLDVSILDELPPGRGKIVTGIRSTEQVKDAASFVMDQLNAGRQAYVVYPLIEESEKQALGAATVEFEKWKKLLPDTKLALLHGRMSPDEKDAVMDQFRTGDAKVLISTTVIEVGVDVPNANTMLIFHADRFGLAQLHQLRGRIGRSENKSYCVLMIDPAQDDARKRLKILEETRDGFRIAEEDLRLRGPGEVLGTQQSGLPDLQFPEYLGDSRLVEQARKIALEMIASS